MSARTGRDPWKTALIEGARRSLARHPYWRERLRRQGFTIHLAILVEPYLRYVLEGKKTVESRFTAVRCAPFRQVCIGDVLLLKKASGPVVGICEVSQVWFYELDPSSWQKVRSAFTKELCAQDPSFWRDRRDAAFATLMQVDRVTPIEPLSCPKRDRRGWVVLSQSVPQITLSLSGPTAQVVALSGRIGSGKSSLAAAVAEQLGAPCVSFGDYVRRVALNLALDPTEREVLQDLGEFLVRYPEPLCKKTLESVSYRPGHALVVDGLRHLEVIPPLRALVAPAELVLVHVVAPDSERERRARAGESVLGDVHKLEKHSTEVQVLTLLPQEADIHVVNDGTRSVVEVAGEIIDALRISTAG
jgi:hypothetical protein